ncbi:helix-turn-helix domain-containing protein [Photobacterium carnosum]|uniref:helix-turn-helix domain-containing protein n=1 Tax=Photobacterium carnosum TaxID=2023717 RepID=UPI001E3F9526|nr:helix-turn-helix transcriptional regulator [Photobacterium carnosum]MCD9528495.1 helix-turn-helix domain-containing protein [Photobacterium carnosum]
MNSYQSYRDQALANPEIKKEYDALEPEFAIIDALLSMRETSGLTQKEVAAKMGTKESNIIRLETGSSNPTIATLFKYAKACGRKLHLNHTIA